MKRKITSGTKFSDSAKEVRGAVISALFNNGYYWSQSPLPRHHYSIIDRVEFSRIPTLTDILKLRNVKSWNERVKIKEAYIKAYPHIEFWDFAEHYPLSTRPTISGWDGVRRLIKVSTTGKVVSVGRDGMRSLGDTTDPASNRYISHKFYDGQYMFHRIVASTFIYTEGDPRKLEVNHKDGVKFHNGVLNLEWTTHVENQNHAYENDLKPVKRALMTMVVPNQFEGRQFVLKGSKELTHVISSINKEDVLHFGCRATEISKEDSFDYDQGFPKDILDAYNENKAYFSRLTVPYIGTILSGQYKGYQFAIVGNKHANKEGFNTSKICACIRGERKAHKGCSWHRSSLKEAAKLPQVSLKEGSA